MWASVVVAPRLWSTGSEVAAHGLQLLWGTCDLPGSGIEPVSLASAGGNTEPPEKPCKSTFEAHLLIFDIDY